MNSTTHPAVQYLTTLFKPDDVVCLTFIHGTMTYANGGAVTENIFRPLSKVVTDAGIKRLTKRNAQEHVFVSMAPFKPGSKNRTKANIAEVRHLFMEADERGEEVLAAVKAAVQANEIPEPTIIVRSSPGKYQFVWNVEGYDIALQEAMNKTLQQRFGTDAQAVDAARVLRIPGFKNIKPKYDPHPTTEIVEQNYSIYTFTPGDFDIPLAVEPDRAEYPVASDETVQQNIGLLEAAMDAADVGHSRVKVWEGSGGAYKFDLSECPWRENHSDGRPSDAIVFVQPSGAYGFKCLHDHCSDKHWSDFRVYLEERAGHSLPFAVKPPAPKSLGAAAALEFTESGTSPGQQGPSAVQSAIITPPLTVVDVTEFIHVEIPKRKMLLAPFLDEKSIGMVHAWRGVGKTHLLTGMAIAQASGGQFLKWKAPEPNPVLYVDGEMPDDKLQKWLREAMVNEETPPIEKGMFNLIAADLQERGIPSLSTEEGRTRIEDHIRDAQTIYFDNISTLFRGGDERTGEDWEEAQEWLLKLRRMGISSVLAHHDGKGLTQRGTSKREDILSWVIQLLRPKDYREEQGLRAEVHFTKNRNLHGPETRPFEIQIQSDHGKNVWTMRELDDAVANAILQMKSERGMSFAEIGKELGLAKSWVKTLHDRAVASSTVAVPIQGSF